MEVEASSLVEVGAGAGALEAGASVVLGAGASVEELEDACQERWWPKWERVTLGVAVVVSTAVVVAAAS